MGRIFETGQFLYTCTCSVNKNLLCCLCYQLQGMSISCSSKTFASSYEKLLLQSSFFIFILGTLYIRCMLLIRPFLMLSYLTFFPLWTWHNSSACKTNCNFRKRLAAFLHSSMEKFDSFQCLLLIDQYLIHSYNALEV